MLCHLFLAFGCCGFCTCFFLLRTVLAPALLTILHTCRIQAAAYDMITYTGKILYTTSADQYDTVLLEIVTFTRDIGDNLDLVRQPYLGYLTQCGVRLLGGGGVHAGTNATTLRTSIQ